MPATITPRCGPGVCPRCFNFTLLAAGECRACGLNEHHLSAMVPISYAGAGGELHRTLADYKRTADPAVPALGAQLARMVSRFLARHEACLARRAGVSGFDTVTVIPSSHGRPGERHPLHRIIAEQVPEISGRMRDLLIVSEQRCTPHRFDARRFTARRETDGAAVLLVDDVWTTGATAESAAAALLDAGARTVAAVVIGRYVNGTWGGIADRLTALATHAGPCVCALCADGDVGNEQPIEGLNQTRTRSLGPRLVGS